MSTNNDSDSNAYDLENLHRFKRFEKMNERLPPNWTEVDVEELVGRVSQRVMDNFYQEIGKTILTKVFQYIGWAALIGLVWFAGIKIKGLGQ
jgi:hypothetical protein